MDRSELVRGSGRNNIYYFIPELNSWFNCLVIRRRLNSVGLSLQDYYDKYFLEIKYYTERPKCKSGCGNFTKFRGLSEGYEDYCSKSCSGSDTTQLGNPDWIEKYKEKIYSGEWYHRSQDKKLQIQRSEMIKSGQLHNNFTDPEIRRKSNEGGGGWGNSGYYYSCKLDREIWYASGVELKCYKDLDSNPNVYYYLIVPCSIDYYSNEDNKDRKYFPDVLIIYYDGSMELRECKVDDEVQANHQLNIDKWESAKLFCKENNLKFSIYTYTKLIYLL